MSTEKRQRQKSGRNARLEVEKKALKRKQSMRRVITLVIVALAIFGITKWVSSGSKSKSTASIKSSTTTTTTSGFTTSADCPASFTAKLNKPTYPSYPPMTIDASKTYTATVTTDIGQFTVLLDPQAAPKTVNNFVYLANQHFYDCITFHRVIPGFMNQTGDPTGTGSGGPGYKFADELPTAATPQYPLGALAMANSGPNTNGSQFFVVDGTEGENLPASYSYFGKVTTGLSVIEKINTDGSTAGVPPTVLHRMVSVIITVT